VPQRAQAGKPAPAAGFSAQAIRTWPEEIVIVLRTEGKGSDRRLKITLDDSPVADLSGLKTRLTALSKVSGATERPVTLAVQWRTPKQWHTEAEEMLRELGFVLDFVYLTPDGHPRRRTQSAGDKAADIRYSPEDAVIVLRTGGGPGAKPEIALDDTPVADLDELKARLAALAKLPDGEPRGALLAVPMNMPFSRIRGVLGLLTSLGYDPIAVGLHPSENTPSP
jgi:hypothetical protein